MKQVKNKKAAVDEIQNAAFLFWSNLKRKESNEESILSVVED